MKEKGKGKKKKKNKKEKQKEKEKLENVKDLPLRVKTPRIVEYLAPTNNYHSKTHHFFKKIKLLVQIRICKLQFQSHLVERSPLPFVFRNTSNMSVPQN